MGEGSEVFNVIFTKNILLLYYIIHTLDLILETRDSEALSDGRGE